MTWESGMIDANGMKLFFTRTGGAKPPLVLAHGYSDDGLCWSPVARRLQDRFDVIMVDARGHGRSDAPETGYDTGVMADDLAAVIRALGLEKPDVLGHSMGAVTAMALAARHPDIPGRIVLEDPPAWWLHKMVPEQRIQLRDGTLALKRMTREEMVAHCRVRSPRWSDDEIQPWADAKLRCSVWVIMALAIYAMDWVQVARGIQCPATLIYSEPSQGGLVGPAEAEALAALVPQLKLAYVPNAGHSIRRENLTDYMVAVEAALR
jgi:N-formylmaleamate deformylase